MEVETRSVTEVIVRTIATQFFCAACYGHLLSLTNAPGRVQASYVLAFVCCPHIVIVQLFFGVLFTIGSDTPKSYPGSRFDYVVHAGLNCRVPCVVYPDRSILVIMTREFVPSGRTKFFSWARCGRLVMCSAALLQTTGSIVLGLRRVGKEHALTSFDSMNLKTSACTTLVLISTMYLLSSSTRVKTSDSISAQKSNLATRLELRVQLPAAVLYGTIIRWLFELVFIKHRDQIYRPLFPDGQDVYLWAMILGCPLIPISMWAGEMPHERDKPGMHQINGSRSENFWLAAVACMALGLFQQMLQHVLSGVWVLQTDGGGWKDPLGDKLFTI